MAAPDMREGDVPDAPASSTGAWSDAEPFDPEHWPANRAHLDAVLDEAVRRTAPDAAAPLVATRAEILRAVESGFHTLCNQPEMPIARRRQAYFNVVARVVAEALGWYRGQTVN